EVPLREERAPLPAHLVPRLVRSEPVAMRHRVGPQHPRAVALIAWIERRGCRPVLVELLVRLPPGGRRAEQLNVDTMRLARVDVGARAIAELRLLPSQKVGQRLQA